MSVSSAGSAALQLFTPSSSSSLATSKKPQSAEQKFLEFADQTPAQRLFNSVLGQLGLTEDQFKALSPDEQQKVAQKIQQLIQQQTQNGGSSQPGQVADKSV